MRMSKIILIVGSTATGKTALSLKLAKKLNASIINADSTQIYKEPIIATAKIRENEKEGIPHYMMDLISLNDDYTLYDYQKEGRKVLDKLINENKNVIIVGGSGLYVKALLYDYKLDEENNSNIDLSSYSNEELKSMADNIKTNDIHVNNRQRLERFINQYNNKGYITETTNLRNKKVYDFSIIGLNAPREIMYKKINDRVDHMVKNGLLEEAEYLYKQNLKNFKNIIGYKELIDYFDNKKSLNDALDEIKKDTRHYAKRQITWYKNQFEDIKWFETDYDDFNNTINKVEEYLNI